MTDGTPFADAHLHPTDRGFPGSYPDLGDAAVLMGCTTVPGEWAQMSTLSMPGLVRFYGVHPWYPEEWGEDSEMELRRILGSDPSAHVGEIGIDSKRGSVAVQIEAFEGQLDIASEEGRIANIHMVGCERDVLEAIRRHARGCRSVILHSFSSESYVKPFAELGCVFSLNPRILARSDARLGRLFSSIPDDRLLLESDAPFTPPFSGMRGFAEALSKRVGVDADQTIRKSLDNARRIIHG